MTADKSLKRTFSELEAERERTWSSSALQVNRNQRRTLVEGFAERRHVAPGDVLGEASLVEVDAGKFVLADVLSQGPAVLIFFRFAGCPACNLALPHYERTLAAEVRFRGAFLVAISPQLPERLVEIKRRHGLSFAVASAQTGSCVQVARLEVRLPGTSGLTTAATSMSVCGGRAGLSPVGRAADND